MGGVSGVMGGVGGSDWRGDVRRLGRRRLLGRRLRGRLVGDRWGRGRGGRIRGGLRVRLLRE